MIKSLLVSALLYCATSQDVQGLVGQAGDAVQVSVPAPSTQDVQSLLNQVAASAAPYADSVRRDNLGQLGDTVSIVLGEYEWVLTENGEGEVDLSVSSVEGNNDNVAASIASLLNAAGASIQNNAESINDAGNVEAQNLGLVLNNDNAIGDAAQQYGAQLQSEADTLSPGLAEAYNSAGAQLAANQDGVADQVNQQLNEAINGGADAQAVQDTAGQLLANLPADASNNLNNAADQAAGQASDAANNVAASIDPVESLEALDAAANTSVADVANAASDALNSGLDQAGGAVGVDAPSVDVSGPVNNAADQVIQNDAVSEAVNNAVNDAVSNALAGNLRGGQ